MKMLFVGGDGAGRIFPGIPLAQAARNAGHEVIMSGPEATMSAILDSGVPAVPVTSHTLQDCRADGEGSRVPPSLRGPERDIAIGRVLGRLAARSLDALLDLADQWRPDLVVSDALAHAGPLAAHHAGVPWVRFATDTAESRVIDLAAAAELAPEMERLGLGKMPAPVFSISLMPPSVRPPTAPVALPLRHVPYGTQSALESWMYTTAGRPRVLVSAGSGDTGDTTDDDFDLLTGLVERVAPFDVELLIATPDDVAQRLGPLPEGVRAGRLPVDVLAPTCDLMVHHADGDLTLTCVAAGVPQLFLPRLPGLDEHSGRISAYGAAKLIAQGDDSAENIADAVREILTLPSYRAAAACLRDEIRRMPAAAQVVGDLERVVAVHREGAAG